MSEIGHEFLGQPLVLSKNYVDEQNSARTLQITVPTSCWVDSGDRCAKSCLRNLPRAPSGPADGPPLRTPAAARKAMLPPPAPLDARAPVCGVLARLGRHLRHSTDIFNRIVSMRCTDMNSATDKI